MKRSNKARNKAVATVVTTAMLISMTPTTIYADELPQGGVRVSNEQTKANTFVKKSGADLKVTTDLSGKTIKEIKNGGNKIEESNYSSDDSGITFKSTYLDTLAANNYTLTVSYEAEAEQEAPADTNIQITVAKATRTLSISNLSEMSKTYDGQEITAPTVADAQGGSLTIEYKLKSADDSEYTATAPTAAGEYNVKVTVPGNDDYEEATLTENFTISAKEVSLTWSNLEFDADEKPHVPTAVITNAAEAIISGDTCTVEVTGEQTEAGSHTATASLKGTSAGNYVIKSGDETKDFIIKGAQEAPTDLKGVAESISGKADGKIAGITVGMEYRKKSDESEGEYTAVTSSDMTFAAGTYEVRYKATADKKASAAAEVTVEAGRKLTVTGPEETDGYELSIDTLEVDYNGSTKVTISFNTEYNKTEAFKVKVNNTEVPVAEDNTFTISDIQEDQVITVEGVKDTVAPTGEIKVSDNSWKEFLNNITFGKLFKKTKDVEISSDDKGSGVKEVYYYTSNEVKTEDNIKAEDIVWSKLNIEEKKSNFAIENNGKVVIYAKIVDNAGNIKYISSDGMVMYKDSVAETKKITYKKLSGKDVTAKINLNGNTIKEIKNNNTTLTKDKDYEVSEDGTITFKSTYLSGCEVGNYDLRISYNPLGEEFVEGIGNEAPEETTIPLSVEKADATIEIGEIATKEYDGKAVTDPEVTKGNATGKVTYQYFAKDSDEPLESAPKDAGDYTLKVTVAEDGSYAETSATKEFTINQKAVTAQVTAENKDYDGTTNATVNATVETGVTGENLTINGLTGTFEDKNAGENKAITVNKEHEEVIPVENTKVDNYKVTIPESTTATINKKAVTAKVTAEGKVYNGTKEATVKATVETGVTDESLTIEVTGTFADKNVGTEKPVTIVKGEEPVKAGENTNVDNYQVAIPTEDLKADITAKEVTLTWSNTEFTYQEDTAQVPMANSEDIVKDDDCSIDVSSDKKAIDAGNYTATAKLEGEDKDNYTIKNASQEYTIKRASQEAPAVSLGQNESIFGKADGKITGLTKDMEYSTTADGDYEKVKDADMTFAAGTYYVRNAETTNYDVSKPTTVTIKAGEKIAVTIPTEEEQVGYTLTVDNAEVAWHGSAKLTFKLKDGYDKLEGFAVKVNGEKVELDGEGTYTISDIEAAKTITVEGVKDITAPTGSIKISDNTWSSLLNQITFGNFFKETQDVEISAEDLGSGVDKVYYYLSDKQIAQEDVAKISDWQEYDSTSKLKINEDNNYVVYAKLVDKAQNIKYISSDGVVIDTTAAVVDGVESNGVYVGEKTFKVIEKNLATVEVNGQKVDPDEDGNYKLAISATPYNIVVTDKAKNETTIENVTVKKADAAVTIGEIAPKEYDGEAIKAPTYETNSKGAVTIEYKAKSAEDSAYTTDAPKDAGEYTVKVTVAEDDNYATTSVTKDFTISKKVVKATIAVKPKEYNRTVAATVNAEVATGIEHESLTITGLTGTFEDANAGKDKTVTIDRKDVVIEGNSTTNKDNYNVIFAESVTGEITAKEVQITWGSNSLTYNGQEQVPEVKLAGLLGQDTCEVTVDGKGKNAGTYEATVKAIDNNNYKLPETGLTKGFEIVAKEVTIEWSGDEFTYNGKEQIPTVNAEGILSGDNCSINVTSEKESINAGDYTAKATLEGEDATNYILTGENLSKEYTIKKATKNAPGVEGVAETIFGKADGSVSGLTTDMEYSTKADSDYIKVDDPNMTLPVGTYYVRYAGNDNYNVSEATTVEITAGRMLKVEVPEEQEGYTLTVDNSEVAWNGKAKFTFKLSKGYSIPDKLTISINDKEIENLPGNGEYTINDIQEDQKITVEGIKDVTKPSGNIKIATSSWESFVNKVTFNTFFNKDQKVVISGLDEGSKVAGIYYYVANEAMSLSQVKELTDEDWTKYDKEKGFTISDENKYVVYAKIVDKADNVEYVSSQGIVIDKTQAEVDGIESNKTYAGETKFTVTEDYLDYVKVNGEVVKPDEDGNYTLTPNETAYNIEVKDKAGNVTNVENVKVDKVKANITIGEIDAKEYNGKAVAPTYETDSKGAVTIEYKAKSAEDDAYTTKAPKDAGEYTVRVTVGEDGTYAETSKTADFEINKKVVTATAKAEDKSYDGTTDAKLVAEVETGIDGEKLNITGITGSFADKNAGTEKDVVVDKDSVVIEGVGETNKDNYEVRVENAKATITAKEVKAEIEPASRAYDGTTDVELKAKVTTGIDGEELTISKLAGSFADKNVGTDKDVVVNKDSAVIAGVGETNKDNYTVVFAEGTTGSITAKEVTITWSETEFNYDGEEHAPKATADGILADDACEVVVGGADKAVGKHTATAELAGKGATNYVLTGENLSVEYEIKNGIQEAPQVEGVAETILGKADGTIKGLTTDMEYREKSDDAEAEYTKVTDPNMTFAAGTYEVRMAAKANYEASKATEVTVNEGAKLTVSVAGKQDGYTLEITNTEVSWMGETKVAFKTADGYSIPKELVIKVNGKVVALAEDDTFTIKDIKENQVITVEGVADVTEPTGKIEIAKKSWDSLLNTITFGKFFNENLDVKITGEDAGSGIGKIYYYVSNEAMDADAVKALADKDWKEYSDVFSISEDNKYVVYAKIVDNAGNTTYISSDGVVIDKVPATVNGVESGKSYTGTTIVTVADDNLESVEINGEQVEIAESYELVPSETPYTIVAKDKAGNVTTIENVTVNWNEVEAPTIASKAYNGDNLYADVTDGKEYTVTENKGGVNAGIYDVVLTLADTVNNKWKTEEAGKATITLKFEITKATPDVKAPVAKELTYNGSEQQLVVNATTNGGTVLYKLPGGEWSKDIPTAKDAGEYTVYYKVEGDDNFNSTEENSVKVTIAKKDAKVKVADKEKTYGENDAELTYEVSGLVDGDALKDVALTRKAGENVGEYEITAEVVADSNPNYNVSVEDGVYTINAKEIKDSNVVVELKDALKYTGKEQVQEVSKLFIDGEEISSDDYIVENNKATEAGVYTMNITMKSGGNYVGGYDTKFVIAPTDANKIEEDKDGNIKIGNGVLDIAVKNDEKAPETTLVTDKSEIIDMLIDGGSLSADELVEIADGAKLDVVLTVEDASETVSEEAKKQIEAKTDGYTIVQYLNISLAKYMVVDGEVKSSENVTETANKIKVSIKIPDELLADGVNRQFYIVRNHNGEVEIIEGVYDEATHTFTFETDKFSDYALAYKDVTDNNANTDNKGNGTSQDTDKKKDSKTAKTGDTSKSLPYSVAMIVGAVGAFIFKKKRH